MEAVAPPSSGHEPACEFVDDNDLAVLDHVVDVPVEEVMRAESLYDMVEDLEVRRVIDVAYPEGLFYLVGPFLRRGNLPCLFVEREIDLFFKLHDHIVYIVVKLSRLFGRARYDKRRPGFVDQNAVHFVDYGIAVFPLDIVVKRELHVVSQVIETELVVRSVGRVRPVGLLSRALDKLCLKRGEHVEVLLGRYLHIRIFGGPHALVVVYCVLRPRGVFPFDQI